MKGISMEKLINGKMGFPDCLLVLLMAICIVTDIKSRRIYNKVLIPFLLTALAANILTGGWYSLGESAKGFLLGLAMLLIPFARGGIGGGDVKLLAVIGVIKGPAFVLKTFLAGSLAGGLIALFLLAVNRQLPATISRCLGLISLMLMRYGIPTGVIYSGQEPKTLYFPYTLAIGTGAAAAYFFNPAGIF